MTLSLSAPPEPSNDYEGYEVVESYEDLEEILRADATPVILPQDAEPPPPMTRQVARRLALQLMDGRLKTQGVPRAVRRQLLFSKPRSFDLNAMARGLIGLTSPAQGD